MFNNDELADALHNRRQELSSVSSKWIPELLSLLLNLSDSPAEQSNVRELDLLKRPPSSDPLTWAKIIAEDPLDNQDGIWDTVDYANESSEDDEAVTLDLLTKSRATESTSSLEGDFDQLIGDALNDSDDKSLLKEIVRSQFWHDNHVHDYLKGRNGDTNGHSLPAILITETQLIREVIFMLIGLPTAVFNVDSRCSLRPSPRYAIQHTSQEAIQGVLDVFASLGGKISVIRNWTKSKETIMLIQSLQTEIATRLETFDAVLTDIQDGIIHPYKGGSVTLLSLLSKVESATKLLITLTPIVSARAWDDAGKPFVVLEELYELTTFIQSIGDVDIYHDLASVFFKCFEVYLKPMTRWMRIGELEESDQTFFIGSYKQDLPLTSLWSSQYKLLTDDNGKLFAPSFLQLAGKKIFTTGKSVIFLKHLNRYRDFEHRTAELEGELDFTVFHAAGAISELCPFEELFSSALDDWIAERHHAYSAYLRELLGSTCGLWKSLDALEYIYFSRNGALGSQISSSIFRRIDRGKVPWNDRFVLTELFHENLASLECVDMSRLDVRPATQGHSMNQSHGRSVKVLASLQIDYTLPWMVANIIKPESQRIYQAVYVFLLQIERAKQLLHQLKPTKDLSIAKNEENNIRLIISLRHRLLWFVNTLQTYMTSTVLSQATASMRSNMEKAEDLDEMIKVHQEYIQRLEQQCLLSSKCTSIHQAIVSLLELTVLFSNTCLFPREGLSGVRPALLQRVSSFARLHLAKRRNHDEESSDDSEHESDYEEAAEYQVQQDDTSQSAQFKKFFRTYRQLLSLLVAGCLEMDRTGAEPYWEFLIKNLSMGQSGSVFF